MKEQSRAGIMTKAPRMTIIYDFDGGEDCECEGKEQYARPILDGDNEKYYGFGFEYNDLDHLFIDGSECLCDCTSQGDILVVPLLPIRSQRRVR